MVKEVGIKIKIVKTKYGKATYTVFSCIEKENTSNIVHHVLKFVVDQDVTEERDETTSAIDYQMTAEKLQLWQKDEAFQVCIMD